MLLDKDSLIIDDVKMAQYLIDAHFGYHKIWSSKSGRNMAGVNSGSLVGIFPKITMNFRKLNYEETGVILSLFNKAENLVTFENPDLKRKIVKMSCYSNDQEFDQKYLGKIEGYSSAVIANEPREYYE